MTEPTQDHDSSPPPRPDPRGRQSTLGHGKRFTSRSHLSVCNGPVRSRRETGLESTKDETGQSVVGRSDGTFLAPRNVSSLPSLQRSSGTPYRHPITDLSFQGPLVKGLGDRRCVRYRRRTAHYRRSRDGTTRSQRCRQFTPLLT